MIYVDLFLTLQLSFNTDISRQLSVFLGQLRHCCSIRPALKHPTISSVHCTCHYTAPVGERSIAISLSVCLCVCLSASISLEPLDPCSRNFVCRSRVAVARSSSNGVVIC